MGKNHAKQYDAIKGGKAVNQLAKQMGTDAKSAYEQLVLADIIRNEATADAEFWDKMTKPRRRLRQPVKWDFYWGYRRTGGGSLASLPAAA